MNVAMVTMLRSDERCHGNDDSAMVNVAMETMLRSDERCSVNDVAQ